MELPIGVRLFNFGVYPLYKVVCIVVIDWSFSYLTLKLILCITLKLLALLRLIGENLVEIFGAEKFSWIFDYLISKLILCNSNVTYVGYQNCIIEYNITLKLQRFKLTKIYKRYITAVFIDGQVLLKKNLITFTKKPEKNSLRG